MPTSHIARKGLLIFIHFIHFFYFLFFCPSPLHSILDMNLKYKTQGIVSHKAGDTVRCSFPPEFNLLLRPSLSEEHLRLKESTFKIKEAIYFGRDLCER